MPPLGALSFGKRIPMLKTATRAVSYYPRNEGEAMAALKPGKLDELRCNVLNQSSVAGEYFYGVGCFQFGCLDCITHN
jgi:hypothetical protein